MPNWALGEMQLVLPTKNVDKFIEYADDAYEPNFYRTLFKLDDLQDNGHGLTKLTFEVECAWSAEGCLISPRNNEKIYLELKAVCEELEVLRLAASFEERGMMFRETINYSIESGITYKCYPIEENAYVELLDDECYVDDNHEYECEDDDCIAELAFTIDDLIEGVFI